MSTGPRQLAGRPRDPQKDIDVLRATRELLIEEGYSATTIVAIARRAGVGAPTIYRRWPRREALIEDAALVGTEPAQMPATTGDLRADLRAWTATILNLLADPVTRAAIPGLLSAYQNDVDLFKRLVSRSADDVRERIKDLLSTHLRELAARDLPPRAEAVFDFLVATTALRALTVGLADEAAFCDRTADALAALAYSTWKPRRERVRSRSAGTRVRRSPSPA